MGGGGQLPNWGGRKSRRQAPQQLQEQGRKRGGGRTGNYACSRSTSFLPTSLNAQKAVRACVRACMCLVHPIQQSRQRTRLALCTSIINDGVIRYICRETSRLQIHCTSACEAGAGAGGNQGPEKMMMASLSVFQRWFMSVIFRRRKGGMRFQNEISVLYCTDGYRNNPANPAIQLRRLQMNVPNCVSVCCV